MFFSGPGVVHREVIALEADPEAVKTYIMSPDRILDYYPSPIDGGVLEEGSSFYCRGRSALSLLELDANESDAGRIVLRVASASPFEPPFTAERIRAKAFFTMVEDWEVEPSGSGTRLTKTWRDIEMKSRKFLPMGFIVRRGAREESPKLQRAWNAAFERG